MKIGELVTLHGLRYKVGARRRIGTTVLVRLDAVTKRTRPQHLLGPESHLGSLAKPIPSGKKPHGR